MYKAIKYGGKYLWNNRLLKLSMKTGRCLTKPMQVYVMWTGVCNFSCPMCKIQEWKERLPTEVIKDLIDQLSSWGVPKFVISGGEPLLFRDEFLDILTYANRKGLFTHFPTNGTNLDRRFFLDYSKAGGGQITLSLDGATKETHDRSRNYNGAFEIAMDAVEAYRSTRPKNVTFKLQPVVTNNNLHEIKKIFEIAKKNHTIFAVQAYDPMDYKILRKGNSPADIRAQYPLWVSEDNIPLLESTFQSLLELRKRHPDIFLNTADQLHDIVSYFKRELDFVGRCLVGHTSLFVVPDGHITMCLYGNIGNIKDAPLKELWFSRKFDQTRKKMLECDRPCLNRCAQRFTTKKVLSEGIHYVKRRVLG